MTGTRRPRYSKEEFARRGDALYDRHAATLQGKGHDGEYVAFDIESGEYEVAADDFAATARLLARVPDAQVWLARVGQPYVHRLGTAADIRPWQAA
jgi:hypothetical protein